MVYILMIAVVLEVTVFAASFWKTLGQEAIPAQNVEYVYGHVEMGDMDQVPANWSEGEVFTDEAGFTNVSGGELLIRVRDVDLEVEQLHLQMQLPAGSQVRATVYMKDEGNAYTYQLGPEKRIWEWKPESRSFLVYPYGKVNEIYIRVTAETEGSNLICRPEGILINDRMPFTFSVIRVGILTLVMLMAYGIRKGSGEKALLFWPETMDNRQKKVRYLAVACCVAAGILLSVCVVRSNPQCRQNLGLHHAQYQELAAALLRGETFVGIADERLAQVDNPYDTIYLQASQIPYQADYAYRDGKYYVYFGIVPELLLYLPYHILTGRDLSNYWALLVFSAGFILSCGGFLYELMRRHFGKVPFYLYPVSLFMLGFGYPLFYMQSRPDLYHVPIAASCMFTMLSLWLILVGARQEQYRPFWWGAGALCMALNAGCRPQFLMFSLLLIPLCIPALWEQIRRKKWASFLAMATPYLVVAAGIMYYNHIRFGSVFDFGALYSMTSNDMTHRGFSVSRILYSGWYYLFEMPWLEGVFPYLRSASIQADYTGRIVSESCFGGIFACSMLYWPVFAVFRAGKRLRSRRQLAGMVYMSLLSAVVICAADATGAGILQRYMADQMPGFALAAVILLCILAEWAQEKGILSHFGSWLTAALVLHGAFLVLVLIHGDGGISIAKGNPILFAEIWSLLQF